MHAAVKESFYIDQSHSSHLGRSQLPRSFPTNGWLDPALTQRCLPIASTLALALALAAELALAAAEASTLNVSHFVCKRESSIALSENLGLGGAGGPSSQQ